MENTKIKMRTSKSEKNYFHFQFPHATTSKFFEPNVPFIMECVKDTNVKIKTSTMRRIDPMPLPPMTMCKFNTRFFWVPMIDICPYISEFETQNPYAYRYGGNAADKTSQVPTKAPIIKNFTILKMFVGTIGTDAQPSPNTMLNGHSDYLQAIGISTSYQPTGGAYDIIIRLGYDDDNRQIYMKFTKRGRIAYKILKQLGYDFDVSNTSIGAFTGSQNVSRLSSYYKQTTSTDPQINHVNTEYSALPLLAFTKVMLNFYENSAFINNNSRLEQLRSLLHIDRDSYELTVEDLDLIIDLACYMTYENDYFITSFIHPITGNEFYGSGAGNISVSDPTTNAGVVNTSQQPNGTPTVVVNNSISATGLKLLQRLTNYLRRHQIAGGRTVDRMLAEYGVTMSDAYSRRTSYIDTVSSVMSITPVLNTTSNDLGDYAGFGSSSVDGNQTPVIEINTGENAGYVIAVDSVSPEIMYTQGYNRRVRHISKFDFLTPSFDAVGTQPIEMGELLCMKSTQYNYYNNQGPSILRSGNKPRYAEYKEMIPIATGDFIVDSVNTDIEGYLTNRYFDPAHYLDSNNQISLTQSRIFSATYDKDQYNRIFYSNKEGTDYIKSIFRFDVEMTSPMKALYDEYRLADDDGASEVTMDVGGNTLH